MKQFRSPLERISGLNRGDDVWQLATVRNPTWIVEKGRHPYRPWIGVCLSRRTERVAAAGPSEPKAEPAVLALAAMEEFLRQERPNEAPARIEVRDPNLLRALAIPLGNAGIEVRLKPRLALVESFAEELQQTLGDRTPSIFAPDVDDRTLHEFCNAANALYEAAPWNELTEDDFIHVEGEGVPEGMHWFAVCGAEWISHGLLFFPSDETQSGRDHEHRFDQWVFEFDTGQHLPDVDLERWADRKLPMAGVFYPAVFELVKARASIPADRARIAFVTELLRAVTATEVAELDAGTWTKTGQGGRILTFSIPSLLHPAPVDPELRDPRGVERVSANLSRRIARGEWKSPAEVNAFMQTMIGKKLDPPPAETDRDRAIDLYYDALDATGLQRRKLARQAVALWPDCAEAIVLLAEAMPDPDRRIALYRDAVAAGERAIGPEAFKKRRGHFWALIETRGYMRARYGLAETLAERMKRKEAMQHWLDMLDLNPDDNLGVRYPLVTVLLEEQRTADARRVLEFYREDVSADLQYARALATFQAGELEAAAKALRSAQRANSRVTKYLIDPPKLPDELSEDCDPGSEEEAEQVADRLADAWGLTPGARDWLSSLKREAKLTRKRL